LGVKSLYTALSAPLVLIALLIASMLWAAAFMM